MTGNHNWKGSGKRFKEKNRGEDSAQPQTSPNISQVIRLVKQGREFFRHNSCAAAKEKFKEAIALDSNNTYALVGLGDTSRKLGEFEEGVATYKRVLEIDPENPYALLGLGDSCRGLDRLEEAISSWKKLLHLQPTNVQVLTRLGDAYRRLERYEEALNVYRSALEYDPYNPYALRGLADSYRGMHDTAGAIAAWEKYSLYHPQNSSVLARLGDAYKQTGDIDKATDAYHRAMEAEEDYVYAYLGLADIEFDRQQPDKGLGYWKRALATSSNDLSPICRRADMYRKHGKLDLAEELYTLAIQHQKHNKYLLTGLASLYIERHQYAQATATFRELLDHYPDDEFVLTGLGDALYGEGEVEEAIRAWEKVLSLVESNTFLFTRLAEAQHKLGHEEEAAGYYLKSLEAGDQSYRTVHGLVKVLQRQDLAITVDDRWVILAAEFALNNRGGEVAATVLRHLSAQGREHLSGALNALL